MTIRIIVETEYTGEAIHLEGGKVTRSYRTFDISNEDLEAALREPGAHSSARVIGAVISEAKSEVKDKIMAGFDTAIAALKQ